MGVCSVRPSDSIVLLCACVRWLQRSKGRKGNHQHRPLKSNFDHGVASSGISPSNSCWCKNLYQVPFVGSWCTCRKWVSNGSCNQSFPVIGNISFRVFKGKFLYSNKYLFLVAFLCFSSLTNKKDISCIYLIHYTPSFLTSAENEASINDPRHRLLLHTWVSGEWPSIWLDF